MKSLTFNLLDDNEDDTMIKIMQMFCEGVLTLNKKVVRATLLTRRAKIREP